MEAGLLEDFAPGRRERILSLLDMTSDPVE
jgi:hypothetical protein